MPQAAEIDAERFSLAELGPGDDALDDALPSSSKISLRSKARVASRRSSFAILAAVLVMEAFSDMGRIKARSASYSNAVLSSDLIIPSRRYSAGPFYSFVTKLNCRPRHQFPRSRRAP